MRYSLLPVLLVALVFVAAVGLPRAWATEPMLLGIQDTGDWTDSGYSHAIVYMEIPVYVPSASESLVVLDQNGNPQVLPKGVIIRDPFGRHRGANAMHAGVDFYGAPKNLGSQPDAKRRIYAAAAGWVQDKGEISGYGYYIRVNHDHSPSQARSTDLTTLYAHLAEIPALTVGTAVSKGEAIGYIGQSGSASSTWSHLHFEILSKDWSHRYDPRFFFSNETIHDPYSAVSWVFVDAPIGVRPGDSIPVTVTVWPFYYDGYLQQSLDRVYLRYKPDGGSWSTVQLTDSDSGERFRGSYNIAGYGDADCVWHYARVYRSYSSYWVTHPFDNLNADPDTGHYNLTMTNGITRLE